jgi:hypothetical protein
MPRKLRVNRTRRAGLAIDELDVLSDDELVQLSIDAPGETLVGGSEPWHVSPSYGIEATRLLIARGRW